MNVLESGYFGRARSGGATIAKWALIILVAHFLSALIRYYLFVRPGAFGHIVDAAYVSGWIQGMLFCVYIHVVLWGSRTIRERAIEPLQRRVS